MVGRWLKNNPQFFAFLLCLVFLLIRSYRRVLHAEIWAEEGTIFLQEGLELGWWSLANSFYGSYHTIQRIVTLVGTYLPLIWLPQYIVIICLLGTSWVFSLFASGHYDWLIREPEIRVLICVLFCLTPGLNEMLGNLPNINWILYLACSLILLRPTETNLTPMHWVFLLLAIISMGTSLLLLPLAVWRGWVCSQKQKRLEALLLPAIIFLNSIWLFFLRMDHPFKVDATFLDVSVSYFRHLIAFGAIRAWLGDRAVLSAFLPDWVWVGWLTGVCILFFGFVRAWKQRNELAVQAITIVFFSTSLWVILATLSRPGTMKGFVAPVPVDLLFMRYSFPVSIFAILFWGTLLARDSMGKRRNLLFGFFCLGQCLLLTTRFSVIPYGVTSQWKKQVATLERSIRTGCPRKLKVTIYPEPWCVSYFSSRENSVCADSEVTPCQYPNE